MFPMTSPTFGLHRKLALFQRYPNNRPRLLSPAALAQGGKAVTGIKGSPFTFCEISTVDGNGVNETHLIDSKYLPIA